VCSNPFFESFQSRSFGGLEGGWSRDGNNPAIKDCLVSNKDWQETLNRPSSGPINQLKRAQGSTHAQLMHQPGDGILAQTLVGDARTTGLQNYRISKVTALTVLLFHHVNLVNPV
jgi:hypothetical protein